MNKAEAELLAKHVEKIRGRRFVEFNERFITKFLNPEAFEQIQKQWIENYDVEEITR